MQSRSKVKSELPYKTRKQVRAPAGMLKQQNIAKETEWSTKMKHRRAAAPWRRVQETPVWLIQKKSAN